MISAVDFGGFRTDELRTHGKPLFNIRVYSNLKKMILLGKKNRDKSLLYLFGGFPFKSTGPHPSPQITNTEGHGPAWNRLRIEYIFSAYVFFTASWRMEMRLWKRSPGALVRQGRFMGVVHNCYTSALCINMCIYIIYIYYIYNIYIYYILYIIYIYIY